MWNTSCAQGTTSNLVADRNVPKSLQYEHFYGIPRNEFGAQWYTSLGLFSHKKAPEGRSGTLCMTSLKRHASRTFVLCNLYNKNVPQSSGGGEHCILCNSPETISNKVCNRFCSKPFNIICLVEQFFHVTP